MFRYVLDTNTVSLLMANEARVLARLGAVEPTSVGIPQPVLAELAFGIERLGASRKRALLQSALERVRSRIARLDWNDDVSLRFGEIKAALAKDGRILEDFDLAIAAHALSLGATLVSGNRAHMARVPGLKLEEW